MPSNVAQYPVYIVLCWNPVATIKCPDFSQYVGSDIKLAVAQLVTLRSIIQHIDGFIVDFYGFSPRVIDGVNDIIIPITAELLFYAQGFLLGKIYGFFSICSGLYRYKHFTWTGHGAKSTDPVVRMPNKFRWGVSHPVFLTG